MSEYIFNVLSQTSKLDWTFPFQRTGAFPLDRSSMFSSLEDAKAYALGIPEGGIAQDERALAGTSYVGQTVSVYNADANEVTLYIIDADRSLKEVGSTPIGDDTSIEVVDNKIRLKDFGTSYFAYVPAEKDEDGNIITPSGYEKTDGFKAGLEPRVVITEDGLSLAWYEPSTETIEGVASNIEVVSKAVEVLDELLNAEGGLSDQITDVKDIIGQAADPENEVAATGLYKEIETLQDTKANAEDVYTKTQADKAIEEAIAGVDHLKRIIVNSVDEIDVDAEDAQHYIYMVPTGLKEDDDKYDEYVVIDGLVEKVGSWEIDLKDYAKATDVETELNKKVDKADNARLMTDLEGEKLADIEADAEKNVINDASNEFVIDENRVLHINEVDQAKVAGLVDALAEILEDLSTKVDKSEDGGRLITAEEINRLAEITDLIKSVDTSKFTVDSDGKLLLNNIKISDIVDLTTTLNNKVEKIDQHRLINPEEIKKLAALSIDTDGQVGISGTVSASNVQELYNVIVDIVTNSGTGVYDKEEKPLLGIERGAEKNYIAEVDEEEFSVDNRKLALKAVPQSKVNGLTNALNTINANFTAVNGKILNLEEKVITIDVFNKTVGNLDAILASGKTIMSQIEDLNARLTWQELEIQ